MNKAANELLNLAFELEEWFDLFGARFKIHDYAGLTRYCRDRGETRFSRNSNSFSPNKA